MKFRLVAFGMCFLVSAVAIPRHKTRLARSSEKTLINNIATLQLGMKHRNFATPSHTRKANIYCKLGFYLAIAKGGVLRGANATFCQKNKYRCLFYLQSYGTSLIRIQNVRTRRYIAVNRAGTIYTTKIRKLETLLHQRLLSSGFTVFWSFAHHGKKRKSTNWYLGMKRTGAAKNASKTSMTHKSGHFFVLY